MKALHVTFRYGNDVFGGAEYYFLKLTEELIKRCVDIDICATTTQNLTPFIKSGVIWDKKLVNGLVNGVNVLRYPSNNPNRYLSMVYEKLIQRQLDKEESLSSDHLIDIVTSNYDEKGGIFLTGWNPLERYEAFEMKWSRNRALILINDDNVQRISISTLNLKKIASKIYIKARDYESCTMLPMEDNWSAIDIDLPCISGKILIELKLNSTWHPLKDHRSLGIAIASVKYYTNDYERAIEMEKDYRRFLISKGLYVDYLYSNAINRPKFECILFDYLRGPNSHEMINWIDKNARNYDLVMAQMFPFNTIKYAMRAKRQGVPIVILPLMHIDDEFYHWKHYYDLLKEANIVLALTEYSKNKLFDKIGANSICIGAGVDKYVFMSNKADGNKFRDKYKLRNKNIILTVSRKSGSKRYDLLIKAVSQVRENIKDAMLVMIGPDDDKLPVKSEQMLYLGKVSQEDLVNAYDACDVFAMMSESESFGMVFCEAWSRKKPVIGNMYCGAAASLIDNGKDGYLCKNAEEISEKIRLLLSDRDLAKELGKNGNKKVIDNYTWDRVADKVYEAYHDLICE